MLYIRIKGTIGQSHFLSIMRSTWSRRRELRGFREESLRYQDLEPVDGAKVSRSQDVSLLIKQGYIYSISLEEL